MSEAYTRVLQGHVGFFSCLFIHSLFPHFCVPQIAIDTAIFPEGTSGHQLDVLARKALWKDGYMVRYEFFINQPLDVMLFWQHGTGHGFGAFLNVHAGPRSFSSNIPLVPGHVITNEPGFCKLVVLLSFCLFELFLRFGWKMGYESRISSCCS